MFCCNRILYNNCSFFTPLNNAYFGEGIDNKLENKKYHTLLVLGLFIYEFLSIHPFHDGNGRLSRLLTTLLLIKSDYDFVKYISFEHLIENRKEQYYAALMECQKNRNTENEKIDKWMLFFLNSLKLLTIKLNIKLAKCLTL
jgi:Fic family protein